MIHVTHTKKRKIRDLPMNELLTKTLKEVIDESHDKSTHFLTIYWTGEAFPDEEVHCTYYI
jgi:hypothetical protein